MPRIDNEKLEKLAKRTAEYVNNKAGNMSKREWMAGIAMQGMLSNDGFHLNYENIAIEALRYADALIKKLEEDV